MTLKMTTDENLSCGYFIKPTDLTIPDSYKGKVSKKYKTFMRSYKTLLETSFHTLYLSISAPSTFIFSIFNLIPDSFFFLSSNFTSYFLNGFSTFRDSEKYVISRTEEMLEKDSSKKYTCNSTYILIHTLLITYIYRYNSFKW